MHRLPSQTNFLEILIMTFEKIDIDKKGKKNFCLMMLRIATNFVKYQA